jgi:transcriptional regulator with XRE-family HTH domain
MDASPLQDLAARNATLPLILKAIRQRRGLRSAEVARAMGMRLRTYQHFESGRAGLDLARIRLFADAVNADEAAILIAIDIGSVDFALNCLDNKVATALLVSLQRFDRRAGRHVARLDPRSVISVFDRAFEDLAAKAMEYDAVLESWMLDGSLRGDVDDTQV